MTVRIIQGDCRDVLATLPAESVQTAVTSPPYFGLRNYGVDGQIGLEPTPDEFVAAMVEVFRGVHRVLRKDGTLWLNLGDSYAGSGRGLNADGTPGKHSPLQGANKGSVSGGLHKDKINAGAIGNAWVPAAAGYKQKDLYGIPWLVAFALRADGWYLRSDIIWSKPNPMPESVRDRPTRAHEYLFLLSKSSRYYYNSDAIREPAQDWGERDRSESKHNTEGFRSSGQPPHRGLTNGNAAEGGRNKRSVWEVAPAAFVDAHFATFPPALIEPCILAGSRPGDTVLDPFSGAGTTALVSDRLGRNAIGIELSPAYVAMSETRVQQDAPLFAGAPVIERVRVVNKQAETGSRTYTGFNARWDAKEGAA